MKIKLSSYYKPEKHRFEFIAKTVLDNGNTYTSAWYITTDLIRGCTDEQLAVLWKSRIKELRLQTEEYNRQYGQPLTKD